MSEPEDCDNQTYSGCPSVEHMLALNPGKTPISLLQEYGTRVGKTPVYDLLKAEGQAHQPNFTFRVSIGDTNCTGQGPSKKAAKHRAAEVCLSRLKVGDMFGVCEDNSAVLTVEPTEDSEIRPDMSPPSPTRDNTVDVKPPLSAQQSECNPVGALQELVVQKGWRLPEYTVTQESGPAHRKEFTMTCRVEKFLEIGSGTSKKLAKRNAAAKMLLQIQKVPTEHRESGEMEPEDDQFSTCTGGGKTDGSRGRGSSCIWEPLRNSVGERIIYPRSNPLHIPSSDFCNYLQDLSKELNFQVSYYDFERIGSDGKYRCLVELSTQPPAVCHGMATTREAAHEHAAYNALEHIQIVTKSK
ncbi:RISC-loading complex subunit TARBP2 isoform X2 [Pyxicephalus adspersus]|uniref:DRBM domain-containing protein n=1 Tax=Pyxicephalus adspersus TaxID=30357 RepID=A0AAV3B3M8_PYXAD|nr:TPA: hypothetical protein GDO54_000502 [Pyxicephalus adspersus]